MALSLKSYSYSNVFFPLVSSYYVTLDESNLANEPKNVTYNIPDEFKIEAAPQFDLTNYPMSYAVDVGQSMLIELPKTFHQDGLSVVYSTVDLGSAS